MKGRKSISRTSFVLRLGAAAVAALLGLPIDAARADENGISFWIPGFFGSLAAAPSQAPLEPTTAATSEPSQPPATTEAPETAKPAEPATPAVPIEYRSALTKATQYSNIMHMSKAGLYRQLTSEYGEKFSAEAAQYAVDNVKADWNAEAVEAAKNYLSMMPMSRAGLIHQLSSAAGDKFTKAQATYAADKVL